MKGKLLTFLLGLLLGGVAGVFGPRFLAPYLPAGLKSATADVGGTVIRKMREGERLLMTIDTAGGAALATFTEKVPEIDILVGEGDTVTLSLRTYEPFVENPAIRAVKKAPPPEDDSARPAAGPPPAVEDEPIAEPPAELEDWPEDDDGTADP